MGKCITSTTVRQQLSFSGTSTSSCQSLHDVIIFIYLIASTGNEYIFSNSHSSSAPVCTFYDNVRCVANVIDRNGLTSQESTHYKFRFIYFSLIYFIAMHKIV